MAILCWPEPQVSEQKKVFPSDEKTFPLSGKFNV
jgi:hypothetical protein